MIQQFKTSRLLQAMSAVAIIVTLCACGPCAYSVLGSVPRGSGPVGKSQPATATAVPLPSVSTPTLNFSSKAYFSVEDLANGAMGDRLEDYSLDTTSDVSRRTGYDIDITVKDPKARTRQEMLGMSYLIAHEFYYSFSNKEPAYLTLHLRASKNDASCVFGLGIGSKSVSKYLPSSPPENMESWFGDLVTSGYYGDLPDQSNDYLACGNDPANSPRCKLDNWKK